MYKRSILNTGFFVFDFGRPVGGGDPSSLKMVQLFHPYKYIPYMFFPLEGGVKNPPKTSDDTCLLLQKTLVQNVCLGPSGYCCDTRSNYQDVGQIWVVRGGLD